MLYHLSRLADNQPIHLRVLGDHDIINCGSKRASNIIYNDMRMMIQFKVNFFDLAIRAWTSP